VFVSVVQAVVFSLLTTVYISTAVGARGALTLQEKIPRTHHQSGVTDNGPYLKVPYPVVTLLVSAPAFAQTADIARLDRDKWLGIAAALAIAFRRWVAPSARRAAGSALEGIARNPQASGKIFVPMIVGLALIESLVIYGLADRFSSCSAKIG